MILPGELTDDDYGGQTEGEPSVIAQVYAHFRALTGDEQLQAMQLTATATHEVTTREWIDGLTAEMKLQSEGETFEIISQPVDPDGMRRGLLFMVRQQPPNVADAVVNS